MKTIFFAELTSSEVAKLSKQKNPTFSKEKGAHSSKARIGKPVVIVVMGATEAHGEHLPLWTDSIVPFKLAQKIAEKSNALVLPNIAYGFCYTLRPWAGTISLKSQTFAAVIRDITRELVRNGFDRILFMNGHGANATICGHVLKELQDELDFTACIVSWWDIKELGISAGHADENEASLVMSLTGWKKRKATQAQSHRYFGRVIPMPKDQFTKYGYAGKVGGESVQKGKKMEKIIVNKLVKLIGSGLLLKEE